MKFFITAKHWQLFILLMLPMFLSQLLVFNSFQTNEMPNITTVFGLTLMMMLILFAWVSSIASECFKRLPPELASSPTKMYVGLVYASLYLVVASNFFMNPQHGLPSLIVPFHLLAMVAIFYSIGFTAKQLIKLEQQKDVSFVDYCGPFFLLWFFPIGVWFLQPKVNRLLSGRKTEN